MFLIKSHLYFITHIHFSYSVIPFFPFGIHKDILKQRLETSNENRSCICSVLRFGGDLVHSLSISFNSYLDYELTYLIGVLWLPIHLNKVFSVLDL